MREREAPGAEGHRPTGDDAISIRFRSRSARLSGLLTPHRLEGIRALNGLPAKGLSCDGGGGIPAYNTRILSLEVEDHISVPVSVDILQGRLHRRSLSAVWTKADCSLVYSGGIKSIRSQDGHRDHPFGSGVDAVREGARLDVDRDAGFLGSVFPKVFQSIIRPAAQSQVTLGSNAEACSPLSFNSTKVGFLGPGILDRIKFPKIFFVNERCINTCS